jgi:Domain of unknown function (DUF5916)
VTNLALLSACGRFIDNRETISFAAFMKRFLKLPIGILLLAQALFAGDNERIATATRTSKPPNIDGFLNDTAWRMAPPVKDFLQRDPYEGQPATEPTEIRILYDEEALYFGCMMYDSEPDKIVARLTRRDNAIESDAISIRIDSYHDHKTAYEFTILASGVKVDILQFNDANDEDDSWDAVWEVKTQILRTGAPAAAIDSGNYPANGWSAEVKIPFDVLRYSPAPNGKNEWGINFIRRLSRKQEHTYWALVRKSQNGSISHFGHLAIDGDLPKPRRLELLPYAVGKNKITDRALTPPNASTHDFSSSGGFDLKYGLNSNLTFDLTVNPDFGQVEADPAVLNLTTFETFYPEKRPFFIEGTQILQFTTFGGNLGPGLFYSRRIGRRPAGETSVSGDSVRNFPEATSILSAAKITGKTGGGLAMGILQAVTAEENATILNPAGKIEPQIVEPLSSYSLVRLKQDVWQNSTIGMIATSVAHENRFPAFTGGVDWNLRFQQSTYSIDGFLANSHTTQGATQRISGSAGKIRFGKDGGKHWLYGMGVDFTSRHYNINDIGFFRRPNDHGNTFNLTYKEDQPGQILRSWSINGDGHLRWNFDGARIINEYGVSTNWQWLNYWEMSLSGRYSFPADDDRESRGLGLYRKPRQFLATLALETDNRRPLIGLFEQSFLDDAKGMRNWSTAAGAEVRPTTWAELSFQFTYGHTTNREAWVTNLTDSTLSPNPISTFGFRDTKGYDLTLRSNLTFTRDLTLQIYEQAFVAKGHYDRFERLLNSTTLVPYNYFGNPDFNAKSFNLNVVWRWEYRPGSLLYLVWTQARQSDGQNYFSPSSRDFFETSSLPAENVVLLKMSYWLRP